MRQEMHSSRMPRHLRDASILSERGSLSLEAAIAMPLLVIICLLFLSLTLAVRTELVHRYALEQTAEEIALLVPIGGLLCVEQSVHVEEAARSMLPTADAVDIALDAFTDLTSTVLLQGIVRSRVNYWLSEAEAGQNFETVPGKKVFFIDWRLSENIAWLSMRYELKTPFGNTTRRKSSHSGLDV